MIAGSKDVDSPVEEVVRHLRCDTVSRRSILAIQDRKIDGVLFLQFLQMRSDNGSPRAGDGVADIKDFQIRSDFLRRRLKRRRDVCAPLSRVAHLFEPAKQVGAQRTL